MRVEDYQAILSGNSNVISFLEYAMIDEIREIAEIFDGGMSLMDWENLQEAVDIIKGGG